MIVLSIDAIQLGCCAVMCSEACVEYRLQWEDVTVSQALALTAAPPASSAELSHQQISVSPCHVSDQNFVPVYAH